MSRAFCVYLSTLPETPPLVTICQNDANAPRHDHNSQKAISAIVFRASVIMLALDAASTGISRYFLDVTAKFSAAEQNY